MEITMDFIVDIVVMFIVFYAGWTLRGVVLLAKLSNNPDSVIKMLEQIKKINQAEARGETDIDGTEIRIEQVNDTVYAYNVADGTFLAQGPTLDEVLKAVSVRFPNQKFWHNDNKQSSQTA
jgi:hypothetical protein